MRIAATRPSRSPVLRNRWIASAFMVSPVFTATPCTAMHRTDATPPKAAVFDVVVHEKKRSAAFLFPLLPDRRLLHGHPAHARSRCITPAAGLARRVDEILHEPIEVPLRLPCRHTGRKRIGEHVTVPSQAETDWPRNVN